MKSTLRLLGLCVLVCLGSCTSYSGYQFEPALSETELRSADPGPTGSGELLCHVLLSPLGIGKVEDEVHVRFKVRIENVLDEALVVLPGRAKLLDSALGEFGPAQLEPGEPLVGPREARTFDLAFAFPDGDMPGDRDLRALSLRLSLRRGDEVLTWNTPFARIPDYPPHWHDPYYPAYPAYPGGRARFSVGFGTDF